MDILAAIKREERKLEKQVSKLEFPIERCNERLQKHWAALRSAKSSA